MKPVIAQSDMSDGEMHACEVDGVDVLLCRVDGEYYAVVDHCSHATQKLSAGRLRGHEVTCPLHGARFDIRDGRCLAAPASQPIKTLSVTLEGGKVNVTVTEEHKPSRPRFGPLN